MFPVRDALGTPASRTAGRSLYIKNEDARIQERAIDMTYDELSKEVEGLGYRDKLRLAQLLIQLARKEEEEQNPEKRKSPGHPSEIDPEMVQYVAERLRKLKPSKKEALLNSVGAMFQFQGGISDSDKERMFAALKKAKCISVAENGRITYPDA